MRKGPYILLLVLFVILIFVVGVRYGQRVEKANKTIDYLISLTPTRNLTPTAPPSVEFKTYVHKACGISFLYPSYLKVASESTTSAALTNAGDEAINVSCPTPAAKTTLSDKTATAEVEFQNKPVVAAKTVESSRTFLTFSLTHPQTSRTIRVTIDQSLYPLFERSVVFSLPVTPTNLPAPTKPPVTTPTTPPQEPTQ